MLFRVAALLALCSSVSTAHAFPTQPVQLVIDSARGAGHDGMGRAVAERLAKRIGPVAVANRTAGAQAVKAAAADGHMLLFTTDHLVLQQALSPDPPVNVLTDFAPVILAATVDLFLIAPADNGAPSSILDLVRRAKEKPGALSYGTGSTGTPQHLGMELLKQRAEIDVQHVAYRGTAAMLADMLAGRIQLAVAGYPALSPHIAARKLRILAVASPTRSPLQPQVPTLREAGIADAETEGYYFVLAPSGTPQIIVDRLNVELNAVFAEDDLRADMSRLGITTSIGSTHRLAALLRWEVNKWTRVARLAGLRPAL
jgi:tripartite-type tricarboxylate transporter receptor subunit TctC